MKKVIKALLRFAKHTIGFIYFWVWYVSKGVFRPRFSFKSKNGKIITLLANAPSLKEVLPRLAVDREFKNTDFIVLNYFANTPEFLSIKPTHYCLADPMFFHKNHNYDKVSKLFLILNNNVDWDMNIYIPYFDRHHFIKFSGLTNSHIKIVPINTGAYHGYPYLLNWVYSHGLTSPPFQTVANMAIFIGINSGYERIRLYGVDHTFFNGLCINDQNQVCMKEEHFYETKPVLKPIIRNDNDKPWKMSEYIAAISKMFKSHDLLADYARYTGTEIINCTQCSLIDSYQREK